MKKNLQIVKEAVWKAIPEIKKLKFMCEVHRHIQGEQWIRGFVLGKYMKLKNIGGIAHDDYVEIEILEGGVIKKYPFDNLELRILGRDIRLADVLATLQKNIMRDGTEYLVTSTGEIRKVNMLRKEIIGHGCNWNLLDDNLDHQSPECLELLANLLK